MLDNELQKPITRTFKKYKALSSIQDNICGSDHADMQIIREYSKGVTFLLCAIDIK